MRFIASRRVVVSTGVFALVLGASSACGDGRGSCPPAADAGFAGTCSSWTCPVASPGDPAGGDTYAAFAEPFFASYCVRCHASERTQTCTQPSNPLCRNGAPAGLNWDDPSSIRDHLDEIRAAVGEQPYLMPPSAPEPSCEERFRVVRWIDAGAPGL